MDDSQTELLALLVLSYGDVFDVADKSYLATFVRSLSSSKVLGAVASPGLVFLRDIPRPCMNFLSTMTAPVPTTVPDSSQITRT